MEFHELKTWPDFYGAMHDGRKTFEVRRNDRDFKIGDILILKEWSPAMGYTGESMQVAVTYVLDRFPGIEDGYCIMQTEKL